MVNIPLDERQIVLCQAEFQITDQKVFVVDH